MLAKLLGVAVSRHTPNASTMSSVKLLNSSDSPETIQQKRHCNVTFEKNPIPNNTFAITPMSPKPQNTAASQTVSWKWYVYE